MTPMTFFLQLAVSGFSTGIVYAMIAIGFVIILKCSQAFNIAQGHFVMIGGYLGFTFMAMFGLPIWATLLAAIATAIIMGLLIERLTLRPLVGQPVLAVIMMTIALGFCILEGLAILIWGGDYKVYSGRATDGIPTPWWGIFSLIDVNHSNSGCYYGSYTHALLPLRQNWTDHESCRRG